MEQDLELIESYLQGTLTVEEQSAVEDRMRNDTAFASRVRLVDEMSKALNTEVADFKKDLEIIEQELKSKKKNSRQNFNYRYLMAAAVSIVALVVASYLIWFQAPTPDRLFSDYFQVPPENITVRASSGSELLRAALQAYNQQDYQSAVSGFEQVLANEPENEGVLFYSGICYLALEQPQDARNRFHILQKFESGEYLTAAQWFLGLTYLKLNDIDKARDILSALHEKGAGKYAADAGQLLKEL